MKKLKVLLMAMAVVSALWPTIGSCGDIKLPPAGNKLMIEGQDPDLIIHIKDQTLVVTFPITEGQLQKIGNKSITSKMMASMAHFINGNWKVKATKDDKFTLKTTSVNNQIIAPLSLPTGEDCEWPRFWGNVNSDWLWISQSSEYYRLSKTGKPGYEMLICADGAHVVPADYPLRP